MVEEYPRNLTELEAAFATEEACRAYLVRLRWPDGERWRSSLFPWIGFFTRSQGENETTICWGYLSEADTPLVQIWVAIDSTSLQISDAAK